MKTVPNREDQLRSLLAGLDKEIEASEKRLLESRREEDTSATVAQLAGAKLDSVVLI
jgi:hypothetical protein